MSDTGWEDRVPRSPRESPKVFVREMRQELRRVAWPKRRETATYVTVVLVSTAVLTALVFAVDFVVGRATFSIFGGG